MFGRKKQTETKPFVPAVQTAPRSQNGHHPLFMPGLQSSAERGLYRALRESVPVVDAAISKIVRLTGSFRICADNAAAQTELDAFEKSVQTNGTATGIGAFISSYLDSLLTYGEAVGEMVLNAGKTGVYALYNASPEDVRITAGDSLLQPVICRNDSAATPVGNPNLVMASLLNQKPGTMRGTSLLEGLPFVSSILLRILESIKTNWQRAGDVRFAVTYDPKDGSFSQESAALIADEWKKAMRSDTVCDSVAVGNVSVKAIGAENQIPDCQVPVRVVMEQIVAKLGIPPFLLGLSWSTTERMSAQQADILTSELEYYRAAVEPVIRKIADTHLRLCGYSCDVSVQWEDINLQDAVELSQARLNNAHAMQIEHEYGLEVQDE